MDKQKHIVLFIHALTKGGAERVMVNIAKTLVQAGYNIFVSGGTGSGKTTFLNALSEYIPEDERVVTIEDSAELQIKNVPNLVRLETRNANVEGENAITMSALIKSALRMRPDRIIVGEVRGEETIDLLQALNTGHQGSLSTAHANSPKDMLLRLETMALMGMDMPLEAIRRQIASGIDIFVQLGKDRKKKRRLMSVAEVEGFEDGQVVLHGLFERDWQDGILRKTGELMHREKWEREVYANEGKV